MSKFISNSFCVPNAIVDDLMAELSGNALKCYMLITRKTTGWGKVSDKISVSQFMECLGIKDKRTVYTALKELIELDLICSIKSNGEITEYSLNFEPVTKNVPGTKNDTSNKECMEPVAKNVPATSDKKCTSTKDNINTNTNYKKNKQKKDFDLSVFVELPSASVWQDFVLHRKNIKAPLTQSAIKILSGEVNKAVAAGYATDYVLSYVMASGWRSFKFEWLKNQQRTRPKSDGHDLDWNNTDWAEGLIK